MCGIAGIYGPGDIEAMTRILAHRGPDDLGYYLEPPIQLGVRRLAIIDLAGGHQPMANEDESLWIVFNGEIFNYQELRVELIQLGHSFRTQSDTEVILHAWEEWGESALDRFNGMFAFALWGKRRLVLARDRMGEKPLYYHHRPGCFLFASEIKSILTQVPAEARLEADFRDFECAIGEDTLFAGIKELLPGHLLRYDGKKVEVQRWWEVPTYAGPYHGEQDYVEELRFLLEDSVRLRLRADVPVGLFLSGGLDSAAIACLGRPEHVFSASFKLGPAYEELEYAKLIAKRIKARHHVVRPRPEDFRRRFPKMIWHLDQPVSTASPIAEFMLAERARKFVKVALGGQGADEIFGGYTRYLLMLEGERILDAEPLRNYQSLARHFFGRALAEDPALRYYHLLNRGPDLDPVPLALVQALFARHAHLIDRMGYADVRLSLPSLLTMNDRATAAFGLENRSPFLDHRIVEFAFRLPPELKVRELTTKYVLRQAVRGIVPDPIIDRMDKKGLVVPAGNWLEGPLRRWCEAKLKRLRERLEARDLLQAQDRASDRGEFDRRAYTRLCLEQWFENFFDYGRKPKP